METHSSVPLWKACIGVFTMVLASGAAVTIAPAYAQPQISNESAQPEIWAPSVKAPIVQPSEQVTIEAPPLPRPPQGGIGPPLWPVGS